MLRELFLQDVGVQIREMDAVGGLCLQLGGGSEEVGIGSEADAGDVDVRGMGLSRLIHGDVACELRREGANLGQTDALAIRKELQHRLADVHEGGMRVAGKRGVVRGYHVLHLFDVRHVVVGIDAGMVVGLSVVADMAGRAVKGILDHI